MAADESMGDCRSKGSSTLNGVRIEFTTAQCEWTLAEVSAGVTIPYEVRIDERVDGVVSYPHDAGGCGRPGPSGLIVFEEVEGSGHYYGIRDEGLCDNDRFLSPSQRGTTVLNEGTYVHAFRWDGRNWKGPSDTDIPKGAFFPPGRYDVTVSVSGVQVREGDQAEFRITATLPITLR